MDEQTREITTYLFSSTVGSARRHFCWCCICLTLAERRRMRRVFKLARAWKKASKVWVEKERLG